MTLKTGQGLLQGKMSKTKDVEVVPSTACRNPKKQNLIPIRTSALTGIILLVLCTTIILSSTNLLSRTLPPAPQQKVNLQGSLNLTSLPEGLAYSGAVMKESSLVQVVGGIKGRVRHSNNIMQLNLATEKWTTLSIKGSSGSQPGIAKKESQLYFLGGLHQLIDWGVPFSRTFKSYDAVLGTWKILSTLPQPIGHSGACILGNKLYIAGGATGEVFQNFSHDIREINSTFIYDFTLKSWKEGPTLPFPRRGLAVTCSGNRVFAIGGIHQKEPLRSVEILDTVENKWTQGPDLPEGLFDAAAVTIEDQIFLLGGKTVSNVTTSIYLLNEEAGNWIQVGSMKEPRAGFGYTSTPNGNVLVFGGYTDIKMDLTAWPSGYLSSVEQIELIHSSSETQSMGPSLFWGLTWVVSSLILISILMRKRKSLRL